MEFMYTEQPMANLSQQQKQEAEQLYRRAVQCSKNKDYASAAMYYEQAAAYGHPGAQNNLGYLYQKGFGVNCNMEKAFELILDAARHGYVTAMRNVATCYLDGIGTDTDFDTAVAWLRTAAEQRDHFACSMLATAYENWPHRDDEKNLYWHKKAAEYGNADSMFFLGDYYAGENDHQDLIKATFYYDNAASVGTLEIKLKVAKAFDQSVWSDKKPLNLEKAKELYTELVNCNNEELQLEAAKGLDELCNSDGNVVRPALDLSTACATYNLLARKGNKEACALYAYCSEIGKGVFPDIDIAIMLYEKAGKTVEAELCRKKKYGITEDDIYKVHKNYKMPMTDPNLHSHGKEFYKQDFDTNKCEYDGRFYYVNAFCWDSPYLCSSDLEGHDVRIISEVDGDYRLGYIHVNITGIYLYYMQDNDRLLVKHIGFDGKEISECREEYAGGCDEGYSVSNVYFYDNKAYFAYEHEGDGNAQIRCMNVDEGTVELIYDKASSIHHLFAKNNYLVFYATYENADCVEYSDGGWMLLQINSGFIECLSNPYCNPEKVIDDPDVYDEESLRYIKEHSYDRRIKFFDLNREIFWIEREGWEGNDSAHLHRISYWEPKLLFGNRDEVISDFPVWKMPEDCSGRREYFDGVHHYYAADYYDFRSSDVYGNDCKWCTAGHGKCQEFRVDGGYLFLDIEAYGEEQYELTDQKSAPIQKSWFNNELSEDIVEVFEKGDMIVPQPEPEQKTDSGHPQSEPEKICPKCNCKLMPKEKFCFQCGTKLENFCPNCNEPIVDGARFCYQCGTKLVEW